MTQTEILHALSRIDLFSSVSTATLRGLVSSCATRTLADGEVLFEHGAAGASFFVVLDGHLQIFRGERIIATVAANEYVGEMTLLDAAPRSAAARALGATTLLEISHDAFDAYLSREPAALAAILRTMGRRLRSVLDDTQAAYEHVNMLVHDMLNLLNVLAGADLVLDALPPNDPHRRFLERIVDIQLVLETMMRGALRKARGVSPPYEKTPVRIDALIRECLDRDVAFHPDVQRMHIAVHVEPSIRPFPCNALDVRRVLSNLLINAAQASKAGDRITVSARQDGEMVTLAVRDHGAGIPAHIQHWIFDPHFSAKPDGHGLGLSSCKDIVERLHQGTLTFESIEGAGATFTCAFPARAGTEVATRRLSPGRRAERRHPRAPARTPRRVRPSRAARPHRS